MSKRNPVTTFTPVSGGPQKAATAGNDVLTAFDSAVSTRINGLGGDDVITGSRAADVLDGGDGNDRLNDGGGIGAGANGDTLNGGAGNDLITSRGVDVIDGGSGFDRASLDFGQAIAGVVFSGDYGEGRAAAFNSGGVAGSITGIEELTLNGSAFGDRITLGSTGATVQAGGGDDHVIGSAGADLVFGGQGNDTLIGGGGADQLVGNAGTNVLTGGAGADVFSLSGGGVIGFDRITDFNLAEGDRLAALFPNPNFEESINDPYSRGLVRVFDTAEGLLVQIDQSIDASGDFQSVAILLGVSASMFGDQYFFVG